MPNCTNCGTYYRLSPYNGTSECDSCVDSDAFYDLDDNTLDVDMNILQNPSGKTQARFDREYNSDS